jgi:hypothetical protein
MSCPGRSLSCLLIVLTAGATGTTVTRLRPSRVAPHPRTEAAKTSPVTAVPPEERCTVRVQFWNMGRGFHHAYIVTSDRRSATHFRAGPAHPGPVAERLWALLRPGSEARQWGPLRAEHGPYVPGSVDYDPGNPPSMTLLQDGAPCGIYNLRLTGAEIALNSAEIPYQPLTTNSNAFVPFALSWIELTPGEPPVPAPGWDAVLQPTGPSRFGVAAESR